MLVHASNHRCRAVLRSWRRWTYAGTALTVRDPTNIISRLNGVALRPTDRLRSPCPELSNERQLNAMVPLIGDEWIFRDLRGQRRRVMHRPRGCQGPGLFRPIALWILSSRPRLGCAPWAETEIGFRGPEREWPSGLVPSSQPWPGCDRAWSTPTSLGRGERFPKSDRSLTTESPYSFRQDRSLATRPAIRSAQSRRVRTVQIILDSLNNLSGHRGPLPTSTLPRIEVIEQKHRMCNKPCPF